MSYPLCHTTDARLAHTLCEKYALYRQESRLSAYIQGIHFEVRIEMPPGRETAFTMEEINWAQGFVNGIESTWKG